MKNFWKIFKKRQDGQADPELKELKLRFYSFQSLLSVNNEILNIMANLESLKKSNSIFILEYLRIQIVMLEVKAYKLIRDLNELCNDTYTDLYVVLKNIMKIISEKLHPRQAPITIPFEKISQEMSMVVGGKNSHLGELTRLGLPVPAGFAITIYGYEKFIGYHGLYAKIKNVLRLFDKDNLETSLKICQHIQEIIIKHPLPPELEETILNSYSDLCKNEGAIFNLAVRSSAIGEDSETTSYAGQYTSVLNVSEEMLLKAFKRVIAGKYNLRVLLYQSAIGVEGFNIPMAVCFVKMINAKAAGVLYTIDPGEVEETFNSTIIIDGVWGLGEYLVEGKETPDHYSISKNTLQIQAKRVSPQNTMLACNNDGNGGLEEVAVPQELVNKQCLTDEQIIALSRYAITIENYYQKPQDIEWVLDWHDNLFIVQARPLANIVKSRKNESNCIDYSGYEILINRGDIVCHGAAAGTAYHIKNSSDIFNFPRDSILIIKKSSPFYSILLKKARGVIADIGGVTGHLASLIRQFNIPAIFNTENATEVIAPGELITLDANNGKVLKGAVKELLTDREQEENEMGDRQENPVSKILTEILDFVLPLNLIDPGSDDFKSGNCSTLHDITRFCHEMAVQTMFKISNNKTPRIGSARELDTAIPLKIYVIDLGDGIREMDNKFPDKVKTEDITSRPMLALLKGMMRDDLNWAGPINIDLRGFCSVFAHVVAAPADYERPLGEGSYFAVSKDYMNFNSRIAYHFAVVDSYCSEETNNNYIIFRFKGGGAALNRRINRLKFLARILHKLEFTVNTREDLLTASLHKYPLAHIEKKLDLLGRLMCFSRQLDMVMSSDVVINRYVEAFLNEDYSINY